MSDVTRASSAAKSKAWRERNPERWREVQADYRERNREKLNAAARLRNERDRDKRIAAGAEYRRKYPEKTRDATLRYTYGIGIEEYDRLLLAQGGVCAICGDSTPGNGKAAFCIDHDHDCCAGHRSCGKCVRGLLCSNCNNRVLGGAKDNPAILRAAADYLESHRCLRY